MPWPLPFLRAKKGLTQGRALIYWFQLLKGRLLRCEIMITGLKNLNVALRRYQNIDGDEALENQEEDGLEDD